MTCNVTAICINTSKLLHLKNLKFRSVIYLNSVGFGYFSSANEQRFEILYLDILLEAKFSYSYKHLPLSSIYHTHGDVCVYFMVRGNGVKYNCNGNPVNLYLSSWKVLWLLSQRMIWRLNFEHFLKK